MSRAAPATAAAVPPRRTRVSSMAIAVAGLLRDPATGNSARRQGPRPRAWLSVRRELLIDLGLVCFSSFEPTSAPAPPQSQSYAAAPSAALHLYRRVGAAPRPQGGSASLPHATAPTSHRPSREPPTAPPLAGRRHATAHAPLSLTHLVSLPVPSTVVPPSAAAAGLLRIDLGGQQRSTGRRRLRIDLGGQQRSTGRRRLRIDLGERRGAPAVSPHPSILYISSLYQQPQVGPTPQKSFFLSFSPSLPSLPRRPLLALSRRRRRPLHHLPLPSAPPRRRASSSSAAAAAMAPFLPHLSLSLSLSLSQGGAAAAGGRALARPGRICDVRARGAAASGRARVGASELSGVELSGCSSSARRRPLLAPPPGPSSPTSSFTLLPDPGGGSGGRGREHRGGARPPRPHGGGGRGSPPSRPFPRQRRLLCSGHGRRGGAGAPPLTAGFAVYAAATRGARVGVALLGELARRRPSSGSRRGPAVLRRRDGGGTARAEANESRTGACRRIQAPPASAPSLSSPAPRLLPCLRSMAASSSDHGGGGPNRAQAGLGVGGAPVTAMRWDGRPPARASMAGSGWRPCSSDVDRRRGRPSRGAKLGYDELTTVDDDEEIRPLPRR
ncbi:hypothetical protein PVAP13_5KG697301 [Panicum virgatum]|uniref:Uncharacterized protein n=1 Tax=Panicum virgatum TaxID=38727 RepID=A0A8T0SV96_PANVG|nr:hypothetical protein PVAP13_5KG697301 [Panicum virgatum]